MQRISRELERVIRVQTIDFYNSRPEVDSFCKKARTHEYFLQYTPEEIVEFQHDYCYISDRRHNIDHLIHFENGKISVRPRDFEIINEFILRCKLEVDITLFGITPRVPELFQLPDLIVELKEKIIQPDVPAWVYVEGRYDIKSMILFEKEIKNPKQ